MPEALASGRPGRWAVVDPELQRARQRIHTATRVVVLTGAGVSAESGVPTFSGPEGLWRNFSPQELATQAAFDLDPKLVWEWYEWRRGLVAPLSPNPAHRAIAAWEPRVPEFLVATQNVDGLHAAAGSQRVIELHGSLWRTRCNSCRQVREERQVPLPQIPPRCPCGGPLRPDIVWIGEPLPEWAIQRAFQAARAAEVVLVVGTSGVVYPVAALPQLARSAGAFVIEVNPEETPLTAAAQVSLRGKAAELVPLLLESVAR